MAKIFSVIVFILILFGGCTQKGIWVNPNITSKQETNIQLKKDDGYCDAVSYGAVPMPTQVINNNNKNGTFNTTNTATGERYSGTYTSNNSGGFAKGFSNGAAVGESMRANADRLNVWKSCMYNLGWLEESDLSINK